MVVGKVTRDGLLELSKKKIYLEGNILKILQAEDGDVEFQNYLKECIVRDTTSRKKRLEVTKQVQQQNKELEIAANKAASLMEELKVALNESEVLRNQAEQAKDKALDDLDIMQKKTQFELIGTIVKVALFVIIGVGVITSIMYGIALMAGQDTQIIGSTWSNMFGILLTNAFSIVGTIMGVKYATDNGGTKE
jgi:hypothetical protein